MSRGWPFLLFPFLFPFLFLFLFLACPGARAADVPKATCPPDAELRRVLDVEPTTPVACHVADREVQMAAIVPPARAGAVPHLIAALSYGGEPVRAEVDLAGTARERLPTTVDDWAIVVGPAGLRGADWLRVDVTAATGEDLAASTTVVSFFRHGGGKLRPLWSGLGDRHESRFDACQLDTVSRFRLSESGALVRTRRTTRTFIERTDIAAEAVRALRAECVAAPPARDTFVVADDGIDANVPVSKAFRALARENRRLFLNASRSPEALGRFITHSLSLIPQLRTETMATSPTDPEDRDATISVSGAQAYMMDSGGRSGLNWKNIRSVSGPRGQALARALAELRDDEGVWISARTDYGGCHQPEQATAPLRRLVSAWNAAPIPIRDAFEPLLVADLQEMSTDDCFCARREQRAKLQRALERNAAILERLPRLGPDAARALRALPDGERVSFNCSPG